IWFFISYCFGSAFAGADAQTIFQRQDEDLAVADAAFGAGASGLHDGVDRWLDEIFVDGDLQLNLAKKIHRQFMSAIDFGMPLLPAKTLHVNDGQPKNFDSIEGFFDCFKLGRLNDSENHFHGFVSSSGWLVWVFCRIR